MGSWGTTSFQSDEGLDFLSNMTEKKTAKNSIEKALEGVICISAFCSEVEALAEIIANTYGKTKCDEKYANEVDLSKAMECVKCLEADKSYFVNTLAKVHYALTIINKLNGVLWKEELWEERKHYITNLSTAIEEVINEVKNDANC